MGVSRLRGATTGGVTRPQPQENPSVPLPLQLAVEPPQNLGRHGVGDIGELVMGGEVLPDVRAHGHDALARRAHVVQRLAHQPGGEAPSGEGPVDLGVVEDPLPAVVPVGRESGGRRLDPDLVTVAVGNVPDGGGPA